MIKLSDKQITVKIITFLNLENTKMKKYENILFLKIFLFIHTMKNIYKIE